MSCLCVLPISHIHFSTVPKVVHAEDDHDDDAMIAAADAAELAKKRTAGGEEEKDRNERPRKK